MEPDGCFFLFFFHLYNMHCFVLLTNFP